MIEQVFEDEVGKVLEVEEMSVGAPARVTPAERAALARLTLARAEQLTGARSLRRHESLEVPVRTSPARLDTAPGVGPVRRTSLVTSERPSLPVPTPLSPLLPDGLRRGSTVAVLGSTSLVLELLAAACSGGGWAAVVGQPTVGLLAAAQAGVALERLAVVPHPGLEAPKVVAALLDGVDVVLVGPEAVLTDSDRRRLVSRARERGSVLLSSGVWTGADVVLTAHDGRWSGVGAGEGRLRAHEVRVTRTGRGGALRQSVGVVLPLDKHVGQPGSAGAGQAGAVAAPTSAPLQLVG